MRRTLAILATATLAALLAAGWATRTSPAGAVVEHRSGYQAAVDGFRSWYGSYRLGALGTAWCIDHGIAAPDADLAYAPTSVDDAPATTQTAIAWALGRHGTAAGRIDSAALMLVLHDLMGAQYPSGPLRVAALPIQGLSGFGDQAGLVLGAARLIRADALAHAHLVGPYRLVLATSAPAPGEGGTLVATLTDANGAPVHGVTLHARGPAISGPATTAPDGTATFTYTAVAGDYEVRVEGSAPDLRLQAFAPTTGRAQRVARAATVQVAASRALVGVAPTPPGALAIHKTGDAEPAVAVAGTRFEAHLVLPHGEVPVLTGADALVIGDDGRAGPVAVPPGRYVVREVQPAPGYQPAGPWEVDVAPAATVTIEAANVAVPGRMTIRKVDATTGEPVVGAVLAIQRALPDGTYRDVVPIVSGVEPAHLPGLVPGHYRIVEVQAPPGYDLDPRPVEAYLAPGAALDVTLENAASTPPPEAAPPTVPTTLPTTLPTTDPPPTVAAPPSTPVVRRSLPRTGAATGPLAALACGLVLSGVVAVRTGRRPDFSPRPSLCSGNGRAETERRSAVP